MNHRRLTNVVFWGGLLFVVVGLSSLTYGIVRHEHAKSKLRVGQITNKTFTPAHTTTTYVQQKIGDVTYLHPVTSHYDDAWVVELAAADGKRYAFAVSEAQFQGLKVLEYWVVGSYESTPEMPLEE